MTEDNFKLKAIQLRARYGMEFEDYIGLRNRQDNKCAICGGNPPNGRKKHLSVDHCHETGIIRGLLCTRCNTALGWFEIHQERVQKYLEDHG